jgi:hypothetical protein
MRRGVIAAVLAGVALTASPASADDASLAETLRGGLEPGTLVLELSMGMAGSIAHDGPQIVETESGAPLGIMASFTAGVRTVFFVTPMIDLSYAGLGGSTERVTTPSGEEALVHNRMEMVTMSFGLLVDLWRFRLRGSTGVVNIGLDSRTVGVERHTSRWDFGYIFGITGHFFRNEGRQLGLEGRVTVDTGNDVVVLTLALVGTLDWPGFGVGDND